MRSFLLISIIFYISIQKAAASLADTSQNNYFQTLKTSSETLNNYLQHIEIGLSYINQGDIEEGIEYFSEGIKIAEEQKKISRISNYYMLEIASLLEMIKGKAAGSEEKEVGHTFVEAVFNDKPHTAEKAVSDFIKKYPLSIYGQRLYIYLLSNRLSKKLEQSVDKILESDSTLINIKILKAEILLSQKQYYSAIDLLYQIIASSPSYAYAYNLMGSSYASIPQLDKALQRYNQALAISPEYPEARVNRGYTFEMLKQYEKAVSDYKKAINLDERFNWADYRIAVCYGSLDKVDSILFHLNRLVVNYPEGPRSYEYRGNVYYFLGEYSKAIDDYSQAIKLAPAETLYYIYRGNAYYDLDQPDAALKDYEYVIANTPKESNSTTMERIAKCYYKKKDYKTAVLYYKKSLTFLPSRSAYVGIGMSFSKLEDYKSAITSYKKALALDSTYSSALSELGWAYYCTGNFKKSISYSYKALKNNEKDVSSMFNIALATLRIGDFEKAKELYEYYTEHCKKAGYAVPQSASDNLKELLSDDILSKHVSFLLNTIFNYKP